MTTATEGGEGSGSRSGRSFTRKDPVPLVQEAFLLLRATQNNWPKAQKDFLLLKS